MSLHFKLWKACLPAISYALTSEEPLHDHKCDCCRRLQRVVAEAKLADAKCDEILDTSKEARCLGAGSIT